MPGIGVIRSEYKFAINEVIQTSKNLLDNRETEIEVTKRVMDSLTKNPSYGSYWRKLDTNSIEVHSVYRQIQMKVAFEVKRYGAQPVEEKQMKMIKSPTTPKTPERNIDLKLFQQFCTR